MNLFIIRHGNTHWNTLGKIQGRSDIDLNDKGINEARLLSDKLQSLTIDIFVTSPLKRAIHTTKLLNLGDIPVIIDKDLIELSFGEWEGNSWEEIQSEYDSYITNNTTNGYANPPGGESYEQAKTRIKKVTDHITSMPYQNIAIVTHRAVIRFMLAHLLKEDLQNIHTFQLDNASILKITNEKSQSNQFRIQNLGNP